MIYGLTRKYGNMKNNRKILAQGSRDGACFIYCLANAAQALTAKSFNEKKWLNAVRSLPFDLTDFLAGRGTEKFDEEPNLLISIGRNFLKSSGSKFQLKWVQGVKDIRTIQEQLTGTSVLVIEVDAGAHWITVVDTDGANVLSSCSAIALSSVEPYSEFTSDAYQRHFNREDSMAELKMNCERVLKIELIPGFDANIG